MTTVGTTASAFDAVMQIQGFNHIPRTMFKRGPMRKAFRDAAQIVAKGARRRIASRLPVGNYPAKRTGRMVKSLRVRVSKAGLLAKVYHDKRPDQKDFYPAFLHYGTSRGLRARDNWIADALADQQAAVRAKLEQGLMEALS
ncbi:hypothetical protein [Castellaniella sp.]|uniref:hypothetical protein n=1 Tax=Castellaniella sp. TaxID=1955812 RepID=UPI003A90010C